LGYCGPGYEAVTERSSFAEGVWGSAFSPQRPKPFASCRAWITPTIWLSQDDKEGDDYESGERRYDYYPATIDRIHLVLLTADDLQLASSGALAGGCIQPLTH
jgi:hypothetical protein